MPYLSHGLAARHGGLLAVSLAVAGYGTAPGPWETPQLTSAAPVPWETRQQPAALLLLFLDVELQGVALLEPAYVWAPCADGSGQVQGAAVPKQEAVIQYNSVHAAFFLPLSAFPSFSRCQRVIKCPVFACLAGGTLLEALAPSDCWSALVWPLPQVPPLQR